MPRLTAAAHALATRRRRPRPSRSRSWPTTRTTSRRNLPSASSKLAGIEAEVAQLQAQEAAAELARAAAAARSQGHYGDARQTTATRRLRFRLTGMWSTTRSRGSDVRTSGADPGRARSTAPDSRCGATRKVGISLPHSSARADHCGQRVSRKDLEPGDLVFFGSPIHHVGMYVGGGEMIEAPYTGARVRCASAFRSDYAGACRPRRNARSWTTVGAPVGRYTAGVLCCCRSLTRRRGAGPVRHM